MKTKDIRSTLKRIEKILADIDKRVKELIAIARKG